MLAEVVENMDLGSARAGDLQIRVYGAIPQAMSLTCFTVGRWLRHRGGGRLTGFRSMANKPCRLDGNWVNDLDNLIVAQTVEVRVRPVWIL